MAELFKALEPAVGAGLMAAVTLLLIIFVHVRKMFRADAGEQRVDSAYAGILATIQAQHAECLRRWNDCEEKSRELEGRLRELENAR